MRYLTLGEVLALHHRMVQETGGSPGLRDLGGLQSALAQPRMTFAGTELYPDIVEKVAALGYSLVLNHPFLDGNKRTGHAAMEAFLLLNGHELVGKADEQESTLLALAAGNLERDQLVEWLRGHIRERPEATGSA